MDIMQLMRNRHSVRLYTEQRIEEDKRTILNELAYSCNKESGLHIQILYDEPKCFAGGIAHYGSFRNANNYIAIVGPKSADLDEKAGYYGEMLVLKAQELGLNTCWVALTHGKSAAVIGKGEKQVIIISLGYGANQGAVHKNKDYSAVSNISSNEPEWFKTGMEAVMLAPTAINQQKFYFTRNGDEVTAKVKGIGTCTKIDLGIVKYHFEAATGKKVR